MRRLWNAAARGDAEGVREAYGPGAVLRAHGSNPLAGEFKGGHAILDYLARMGELVDDLHLELLDVYSSDEGAVIRYRTVADRGPKHLDMEYLYVGRIAHGRVVEVDLVAADQRRSDDFWRLD
jgi:ketosteroid isomerase-like protein